MIDFAVAAEARTRAADRLADAGIVLTADEEPAIEIADFGMGDLPRYGLEVLVYVNNDRYCAKDLVLFPHQICPEHRHPPVGDDPGKQETFRVRVGVVYLYVEGDPTAGSDRLIPPGDGDYFTARCEIVLRPGEQYTIAPNIRHWFAAGEGGAIVSEFSSTSRDELDIFTDPRAQRVP